MNGRGRPRLLLLGANGQVGWELRRTLAALGDVRAYDRARLDVSDLSGLARAVQGEAPDVIVNAAAYTNVDKAESETELARRINADVPRVLADHAARSGSLLVHYSTDYVFDGESQRPYVEHDVPNPRTAYGQTKLSGDEAILRSGAAAFILRVAWVYSLRGHNFLRTIRRLAGEGRELRVVADQCGSPTWSRAIAEASAMVISRWLGSVHSAQAPAGGVYHMAAPDHATWHEFASAIVALDAGRRNDKPATVHAITSSEYPTPARRPRWSVLDSTRLVGTFGVQLPRWREQLALCLDE